LHRPILFKVTATKSCIRLDAHASIQYNQVETEIEMKKKLDQLLVVDIESTCWESKPPNGQKNDIIEIGVCGVFIGSLTVSHSHSIMVRPTTSTVSSFCTKLTTLTPEMVNEGISFAEACVKLKRDHNSSNRTWASWGDYDRRQFERQCHREDVKYPFGITHLNLKNLFALKMGLTHEVGMDEALRLLDMELEGTHHRAIDDARNIAYIAGHLLARGV